MGEKPLSPEDRLREAQERINNIDKAQMEEAQALSASAREKALAHEELHRLGDRFQELSDARMAALTHGDKAEFDRLGIEMNSVMAERKKLKEQ